MFVSVFVCVTNVFRAGDNLEVSWGVVSSVVIDVVDMHVFWNGLATKSRRNQPMNSMLPAISPKTNSFVSVNRYLWVINRRCDSPDST